MGGVQTIATRRASGILDPMGGDWRIVADKASKTSALWVATGKLQHTRQVGLDLENRNSQGKRDRAPFGLRLEHRNRKGVDPMGGDQNIATDKASGIWDPMGGDRKVATHKASGMREPMGGDRNRQGKRDSGP